MKNVKKNYKDDEYLSDRKRKLNKKKLTEKTLKRSGKKYNDYNNYDEYE